MNPSTQLQQHYHSADKFMLKVAAGLLVFSLVLAPMYGTWVEAIVISGVILSGMVGVAFMAPGSAWSRSAVGMGFMLFTALHIQQSQGMLEIHFGVFVLLAVLLVYRDWVPIVAAAATIAVHHLFFYALQANGSELWLLPTMENGMWIVGLHAFYVVFESSLLIYMANQQKQEFVQATELLVATNQIVADEKLDLTVRTSGHTSLLQRFDHYTEAVANLSKTVKLSADSIHSDGALLQRATETMLETTGRQSSESQQISENIDQLSQLIAEVSRDSSEISDGVTAADEKAEKSALEAEASRNVIEALADQIGEAKSIIEALDERSKSISSVMDVIRNIADQTNLLALNAAIEAARAGEQGRGFAVVADEVRTLAQRTQDSTQDIDQMVEALQQGSESSVRAIIASEKHVEDCLDKTQSAQLLMQDIRKDVASLNDLGVAIKQQTQKQLTTVEQINGWTDRLAQDSIEAVDGARAVAESGKSVQNLATSLSRETARFKLDD